MILDILRVLIEKILIQVFTKKLEKDPEFSENSNDSMRIGKQDPRFSFRPIMAKVYVNILHIVEPIFRVFTIVATLLLIAGGLYLRFVDETILSLSDMTREDKISNIVIVVSFLCTIWGIEGLMNYMYQYMKHTRYEFRQDKIYIQSIGKKGTVIEYKDFKKCIAKKKIKIRNGRLEFPYANGNIPVYTWGDDAAPSSFFHFISMRCGINLPRMDRPEAEMVRKIGFGWSLSTVMTLPLFGIAIWEGVVIVVCDFGIEHGLTEMVRYFVDYFFSIFNFFGIMGAICMVIGLLVKFHGYFLAKKHFVKYKDIIKVLLF